MAEFTWEDFIALLPTIGFYAGVIGGPIVGVLIMLVATIIICVCVVRFCKRYKKIKENMEKRRQMIETERKAQNMTLFDDSDSDDGFGDVKLKGSGKKKRKSKNKSSMKINAKKNRKTSTSKVELLTPAKNSKRKKTQVKNPGKSIFPGEGQKILPKTKDNNLVHNLVKKSVARSKNRVVPVTKPKPAKIMKDDEVKDIVKNMSEVFSRIPFELRSFQTGNIFHDMKLTEGEYNVLTKFTENCSRRYMANLNERKRIMLETILDEAHKMKKQMLMLANDQVGIKKLKTRKRKRKMGSKKSRVRFKQVINAYAQSASLNPNLGKKKGKRGKKRGKRRRPTGTERPKLISRFAWKEENQTKSSVKKARPGNVTKKARPKKRKAKKGVRKEMSEGEMKKIIEGLDDLTKDDKNDEEMKHANE